MDLPKITIVTPSYNQGIYLEATIRSVLEQGYPNLEYIIADGGSTDQSVEIIKRYSDRLTWWCSEKDKGQPHAINKGFAHASGDLHAYINSDDTLMPGSLMAAAQAFRQGHEWISGWVMLLYDEGEWPQVPSAREVDLDWITLNPLCQQATYWSARLAKQLGPFRESLHYCFDYEYWLRLWFVARAKPCMLNRCMGTYRMHSTSKTVSESEKFVPEWEALRKEYRKYLQPGEQRLMDKHFRRKAAKEHYLKAWSTLKAGDVSSAKDHARKLVKLEPFSLRNLKTFFCAMRGY